MKNYIFGAMISFAALMASCNSDLNDIQTPEANGEPYQVNIKLAGSAKTFGKGVFTKAPDANALEGETNVSKLLAVAFDDADASNVTKSEEEETVDDGDKFYKLIEVAIPEATTLADDGDLSFGLGKEGDFQICFIANANDGLKGELETLLQSGTDVEDLKNYIMDYNKGTAPAQAPDSKGKGEGLLMVSPFYPVSTSFTGTTAPLSVVLTRLMARLDLVNACDGINVQKITFNKRAVGTRLFNDEVLEPDAGTLETAAKEYDLSTLNERQGLVGNSAAEAKNISYKGEIYTYSQFGTSTSGEDQADERPSIVIEYKMPSVNGGADTYSYTLLFVNGDASTVKPLKANNLYTLKMSNSNNNVEFTLSVADWNTGDVLEVGGGSIAAGVTGNVVLESTKVSDVPAWTGGETENVTAQ